MNIICKIKKLCVCVLLILSGATQAAPRIAGAPFWSISYDDELEIPLFENSGYEVSSLQNECLEFKQTLHNPLTAESNFTQTREVQTNFFVEFFAFFSYNGPDYEQEMLKNVKNISPTIDLSGDYQFNNFYFEKYRVNNGEITRVFSADALTALASKYKVSFTEIIYNYKNKYQLKFKGRDSACDFVDGKLNVYLDKGKFILKDFANYEQHEFYQSVNDMVHETFEKTSNQVARAAVLGFRFAKKLEHANTRHADVKKMVKLLFNVVFVADSLALNPAAWGQGQFEGDQQYRKNRNIVVPNQIDVPVKIKFVMAK
jgi:hypothetical protein